MPPEENIGTRPLNPRGVDFTLQRPRSDHQGELDEHIGRHASGWALDRIAPLERAILRTGLLEMLHPDLVAGDRPIPPTGAIEEAVEIAKDYCGAEAPGFVNGILGAVLRAESGDASRA